MIDGDRPGVYLAQRGAEYHLERTASDGTTEVIGTTRARTAARALLAFKHVHLVADKAKLRTTTDPDRWMVR